MARAERKRLHVMVTPRQHEKFQKLSDKTGYSVSELMRRAFDLYFNQVEKKNVDG